MECIVDRFEGDYAVVQCQGTMLNVPRLFLPADTKEGDLLDVIVTVDTQESLRENTKALMDAVWQD